MYMIRATLLCLAKHAYDKEIKFDMWFMTPKFEKPCDVNQIYVKLITQHWEAKTGPPLIIISPIPKVTYYSQGYMVLYLV
jgi:hypothetical protein